MCSNTTPNADDFMTNLRRPMPLGRKVGLLFRNMWIKVSKRQTCCGHPGEPGC
jgi:hypothetical protein